MRTVPCDGSVIPTDIVLWNDEVLQISVVNSTPGNDAEFIVRVASEVTEEPELEP